MAQTIIFLILAAIILGCGVIAVTAKRLMRAVTALIFVLFSVSGLYFLMGYTFLGAVQIIVYAGGIVVLYIFAVMLTSKQENTENTKVSIGKKLGAAVAALCGAAMFSTIFLMHKFADNALTAPSEDLTNVKEVGNALVSADKFGYVLPFEAVGILLLACIVCALIIARKR